MTQPESGDSRPSRSSRRSAQPAPGPRSWRQWLPLLALTTLALLAVAFALPFAVLQLRADFGTQETRTRIAGCNPATAAAWPEAQWTALQQDMLAGIAINPEDPALRDALARLYACHGLAFWTYDAGRKYWFTAARGAYEASLALRPDNTAALAGLAVALSASEAPAAEINAAWLRALRFGAMESPVQAALADLALRHWSTADPEMRRWMRQQLDKVSPDRKQQLLKHAARLGVQDLLPAGGEAAAAARQ